MSNIKEVYLNIFYKKNKCITIIITIFIEILGKIHFHWYRDRNMFRGSSVVEQSAVNRSVVSSNLTRGAIKFLKIFC